MLGPRSGWPMCLRRQAEFRSTASRYRRAAKSGGEAARSGDSRPETSARMKRREDDVPIRVARCRRPRPQQATRRGHRPTGDGHCRARALRPPAPAPTRPRRASCASQHGVGPGGMTAAPDGNPAAPTGVSQMIRRVRAFVGASRWLAAVSAEPRMRHRYRRKPAITRSAGAGRYLGHKARQAPTRGSGESWDFLRPVLVHCKRSTT
jgi:hypothetical protein